MILEISVGIAGGGALVWYLVRFLTRLIEDMKRTWDNHMEHNTIALVELRRAIDELRAEIREHGRSRH